MATEWKEVHVDQFTEDMFDPYLYRIKYSSTLHRFLVRPTTKSERVFGLFLSWFSFWTPRF